MRSIVGLTTGLVLLGVSAPAEASPTLVQSPPSCPDGLVRSGDFCVRPTKGGFGVGGKTGSPGRPGEPGTPGRPAAPAGPRFQTRYVPACDGNDATGPDALCTYATTTCPDPAQLRVWVYRRQVSPVQTEFARSDGSVCLDAADPGLDPTVSIPAIVNSEFQRVVVLRAEPVVNPAPDTLVNIPTRFATTAPASYDLPVTVLGRSVVITAAAESYAWVFGDGEQQTVRSAAGRTEHVYTVNQTLVARVDVTWSGTFRVDGGPAQPVTGTVTTRGQETTVVVKQARSELIGG